MKKYLIKKSIKNQLALLILVTFFNFLRFLMHFRIDKGRDSYSKAPRLIAIITTKTTTAVITKTTVCQSINYNAKNQTGEVQRRLHQN